MKQILGSVLAGLVVLQASLPSLGLEQPEANVVALTVAVFVAGSSFFLREAPASEG